MDGGHMHGMTDMPPPTNNQTQPIHHHMMMHMTFFWGKNGEILFPGWPGTSSGMYTLVLLFVFFLAFFVEFLSHTKLARDGSGRVMVGLIQTLVHTIRVGLAYMVMLAVMSFNGGVFIMAVAGHALGFLVFGTSVFKKQPPPPLSSMVGDHKSSDQSPMMSA